MFMDNHPDVEVRRSIGYAIQNCDGEGLVAALWNLRQSTNATSRASGAWSLGFICKNPDMSLPALVGATKDRDWNVRENALVSLGKFGTNALSATNIIYRAMEDPDRRVRVAATNALNHVLEIEVTSE
jgi:HEAT repeat protein